MADVATDGAAPALGLTPGGSGRKARILWTFADQALSSLTNAALSVVIARQVSVTAFGAFSLAFISFQFVVGLSRSFAGEPYIVRFSAGTSAQQRDGMRRATGAALSLGLLAGVLCLVAVAVVRGESRTALAALAVCLPGLVLQDTWRHVFFATGRPAAATLNDVLWAVLQFGALGVLFALGSPPVAAIILAWGLAGVAAAGIGCLQTGVVPGIRATRDWVLATRDLSSRLGLGYALNMGAVHLATSAVGALIGLAAVAAFRAAQVLLGPLNLVFAGFNAVVLPMYSRRVAAGLPLLRIGLVGSAALTALTTAWVAVLVFLPTSIGEALLGDSWDDAHRVMVPAGLVLVAGAAVLGASNALIAHSRADLMLRVTIVQGPLILGLGVVGGLLFGAVGAVSGFAVAQFVGLALCWVFLVRLETARRAGPRHRR